MPLLSERAGSVEILAEVLALPAPATEANAPRSP